MDRRDPTRSAEIAESLDLQQLSPRGKAIAGTLGAMAADGYTLDAIARFYGKSRPWVSARLRELRTEIEQLTGVAS